MAEMTMTKGIKILGETCQICGTILEILDEERGYVGCPNCLYYIDVSKELGQIWNSESGVFDINKLPDKIKKRRKRRKR